MNITTIATPIHFSNSHPTSRVQGERNPSSPQNIEQPGDDGDETNNAPQRANAASKGEMQTEDLREIRKLKARDREVRAHEAAHVAVGGSLVRSGARLDLKRGPDGVMYAVGGEVSIDTSPGRTPEETLQKAQQIRRAALAPADPSGPDRAIAAKAAQMAQQARAEIAKQAAANDSNEPRPEANGINQYIQISSLAEPEPTNIDDVI